MFPMGFELVLNGFSILILILESAAFANKLLIEYLTGVCGFWVCFAWVLTEFLIGIGWVNVPHEVITLQTSP